MDEQWLARCALADAVARDPGLLLLDAFSDCVAALGPLERLRPDVVLVDPFATRTGDPERVVRSTSGAAGAVVVVADDLGDARALARAWGADAFIDKRGIDGPAVVTDGIRAVSGAEGHGDPDRFASAGTRLTPAELRLLPAICSGTPYGEIARRHHYSEQHVRNTASTIARKLGAHGRAMLAAEAFRRGLWSPAALEPGEL